MSDIEKKIKVMLKETLFTKSGPSRALKRHEFFMLEDKEDGRFDLFEENGEDFIKTLNKKDRKNFQKKRGK